MTSRIVLAALALALATAPAMALERTSDGHASFGGRDTSGYDTDEGRAADEAGQFMNSVNSDDGPYGGGSAHGPHADGGSCGCQGPGGFHAGPI